MRKMIDEDEQVSIHSWTFENENEVGIAMGQFDRTDHVAKDLVSIGKFSGDKQIIINRTRAQELGFVIVYE